KKNTYNTGYSLIVTDSTTNPALAGLSMGERTGSRVLQWVWSYVPGRSVEDAYSGSVGDDVFPRVRASLPPAPSPTDVDVSASSRPTTWDEFF
ncbi:hypothetical protein LY76DRAFT_526062, partial [Colletotrichum caudatum]